MENPPAGLAESWEPCKEVIAMRIKLLLPLLGVVGAALALVVVMGAGASAQSLPTGEVALGQTTIEPAYNDMTGSIIYLLTPNRAPMPAKANPIATAPLYVIVYPTSAATSVGTLNCLHLPGDNCPDHGPGIAGAAAAINPSVYGGGVLGHDHLLAAPASGGDFNVAWVPTLVLFTSASAANNHITTLDQLNAAIANGDVLPPIPLPQLTFLCSVVSVATYNAGTAVTPVGP